MAGLQDTRRGYTGWRGRQTFLSSTGIWTLSHKQGGIHTGLKQQHTARVVFGKLTPDSIVAEAERKI